jgi:thiamine-phosphate pyrophosphorylase
MTPAPESPRIAGVYVIADPDACGGRPVTDIARAALEGGASMIQWRDKRRDKGDQLADARTIGELCRARGAPFIVNDHADLALAAHADGVHLGQHDLPIADVRPIVGQAMIIGVSTNNVDEARAAEAGGADYIAVGAIFPTASKDVTRPASIERLRKIAGAVSVPVVAIGGINASNIASVVEAGASAAAVISAVCAAANPRAATEELVRLMATTRRSD